MNRKERILQRKLVRINALMTDLRYLHYTYTINPKVVIRVNRASK
jgi:hypothetical protein